MILLDFYFYFLDSDFALFSFVFLSVLRCYNTLGKFPPVGDYNLRSGLRRPNPDPIPEPESPSPAVDNSNMAEGAGRDNVPPPVENNHIGAGGGNGRQVGNQKTKV